MKRKSTWILALVAVLVIAGGLGWYFLGSGAGERPFADLEASDLQRATVTLSPPDETYHVVELKELVGYLQDLVIYEEDESYTEYAGQAAIYTLTMADGTERTVTAYNPFLIVDGVGYRTKYEPCNALNQLANDIAGNTSSQMVLEEPPRLDVVSDNTCTETLRGGYSWTTYDEDGIAQAEIADSLHPLDCQELLTLLDTTEPTAQLEFQVLPTEIEDVRCWSDGEFGNPTAESEAVELDGQTIRLLPGGHVYEVTARWEGEDYEGSVSYSFWINSAE